ncbi:MAG: phosphatase PAP2 family protein [Chloroflexota bacterium]|nr:phosphatase PAP2 family protein [Chloroflexota bacterium]
MSTWDHGLFLAINGLAGRWGVLDGLMTLVVGEYFIPVAMVMVLLAMWLWGRDRAEREKNQAAVFCALIGVGFANAVIQVLNDHLDTPRPFELYGIYPDGLVHLLFYQPTDPSFPSNIAAVGFAFAVGAWSGNRWAGGILLGLALLWSFSRVYVGVHFPLDILGGAAIGIAMGLIAFLVVLVFRPVIKLVTAVVRWLYLA